MRRLSDLARRPVARLAGALVGASALGAAVVRPVSDPSPWLHLRVGQWLASGGRFGLPDPFTPSAVRAYVPTQWLPSVVGYELVRLLGVPAVAWLRVLAVLALLAVLVLLLRRRVPPAGAVVGAVAGTLLVLPAMTERPQTAGLVLLALSVLGWSRSAHDGRRRWWLVALAWLFAATHGLWAVALAVGAVTLAGLVLDGRRDTARHLLPVLLLQAVATALTPLGPALLLTPLVVGENGRRFVEEWQPGTLADPQVVVTLGLVALLAVVVLAHGERLRRSELLVLALALVLTASAVRTAAPALLVAAPVLGDHFLRGRGGGAVRPAALPLAAVLAVTLVAGLVALPVALARTATPTGVPVALAPAMTALPPGTVVLAQNDVSGWVLWTAPQVVPVLDLRVESFSAAQLLQYTTTYQARPGWESLVDRSGASYALLPDDAPLAEALEDVRHWTVRGHADGFLLLERAGR